MVVVVVVCYRNRCSGDIGVVVRCYIGGIGLVVHCGPDQPKTQNKLLGHSLVRSLVRSLRLLIRLLRKARFAALTRLLAHALRSLPCSWDSD